MSKPIKIVGLGGALSETSTSLWALEIAMQAAQEAGAEIQVFDLSKLNLPLYDLREKTTPLAAQEFCQAITEADAMIWSSPLYHGTVSGVFKNAIDWIELLSKHDPPYLTNKVVGLIATAGGSQALQAINTMNFMVRSLRGWALPFSVPIAQTWNIFDKNGQLQDESIQEKLVFLGQEILTASRFFVKV